MDPAALSERAALAAQVRAGYDAMAHRYRAERGTDPGETQAMARLTARLTAGCRILDAGCGSGEPIARELSTRYRVVGVDLSLAQLRLARATVPLAALACQDMARLGFAPRTFDAICAYYSIIHIPRELHAGVLSAFREVLVEGGLALLCLGADDNPAQHGEFMGAPMFWSHYDAPTNLDLLRTCGFEVLWHEVVADQTSPGSEHLFALGRKAPSS